MNTAQSRLPLIAITMGDPAGIGPEVLLKALSEGDLFERCTPLIMGDAGVLSKVRRELGLSVTLNTVSAPEQAEPNKANLISLSNINLDTFQFGVSRKDLGLVSTFYIVKGTEFCVSGKVDALVTAPINKAMLHEAGYDYTGHTEMLKDYTHADYASTMLVGDHIRITRVTSHLPISRVAERITKPRVLKAIRATNLALADAFGIANPHVAVCALNPHGGEDSLFGSEEMDVIRPAVEEARAEGIRVSGPMPSDIVFPRARDGQYDAVVCMYHDQALIPFRLIDFGYGVNITLGLPVIRTSPDHGTAYDIAGKGIASEKSMIKAIRFAAQMVEKRQRREANGR